MATKSGVRENGFAKSRERLMSTYFKDRVNKICYAAIELKGLYSLALDSYK